MADDDAKKIGTQVGYRAHEQTAGAATFDDKFLRGGIARGDEALSGSDEVGEGVALFGHATGVVPGLAKFAAATHVRDGVDYAAVEQAEAIGAEVHRDGDAIASVAVTKERSAGAPRGVAAR